MMCHARVRRRHMTRHLFRGDAHHMSRWLTDDEQRAWRGLLQMTSRLNARLNRELQQASGLSLADYDVLVLLTEAVDGRLRVFEIVDQLQWEQSRLSHHL